VLMLTLRSLVFAIVLYVLTAIASVISVMIGVLAPRFLPPFAALWSRTWLKAYELICGVTYVVRGREHVPAGGCILAIKHQSTWDTFSMFAVFRRPVYVLKSELMWIPFFGWALAQLGCIPVKRGTGKKALDSMAAGVSAACEKGRQVVIFPEGTRTPVGSSGVYKSGISHLYMALEVPCIPVAVNSGLFWPRRKFLRPAGVITAEILPPIPPGLERREMLERLSTSIEQASQRLAKSPESADRVG
jgi:1-acyl-sn-glycerol-3-phosphate acyltransferase